MASLSYKISTSVYSLLSCSLSTWSEYSRPSLIQIALVRTLDNPNAPETELHHWNILCACVKLVFTPPSTRVLRIELQWNAVDGVDVQSPSQAGSQNTHHWPETPDLGQDMPGRVVYSSYWRVRRVYIMYDCIVVPLQQSEQIQQSEQFFYLLSSRLFGLARVYCTTE